MAAIPSQQQRFGFRGNSVDNHPAPHRQPLPACLQQTRLGHTATHEDHIRSDSLFEISRGRAEYIDIDAEFRRAGTYSTAITFKASPSG
ncbi:Uncharacterised protein [Mycobacteroides abscessus subsp. abscessus]|nr:Uncharacterised protein [Mycobacteroides abscessus subsp. abscessus]